MANTDKQAVTSKRDQMLDRLKTRYPDREFADDEAVYGQIYDDYDDYDSQVQGYQDREKAFTDMFTSDPRSAHFINNWRKGEDPVVGLVRQFGTDIVDAVNDPERQEEIAAANKEFVARVAKEKALDDEYVDNLGTSLQELERMRDEEGYSDDELDDAMEFLIGIVRDGVMGKFTPDSIKMALKAINHDADVETAGYEAEVRGKNARIEERLRKRGQGDGTSALDGRNGSGGSPMPSLGALDQFGENNQTIWERGGEKRTKN